MTKKEIIFIIGAVGVGIGAAVLIKKYIDDKKNNTDNDTTYTNNVICDDDDNESDITDEDRHTFQVVSPETDPDTVINMNLDDVNVFPKTDYTSCFTPDSDANPKNFKKHNIFETAKQLENDNNLKIIEPAPSTLMDHDEPMYSDDDDDDEMEESDMNKDEEYEQESKLGTSIVTKKDYDSGLYSDEYSHIILKYYKNDDIIADAPLSSPVNPGSVIGYEAYDKLHSGEKKVIYIQNDKLKCYYKVMTTNDDYFTEKGE